MFKLRALCRWYNKTFVKAVSGFLTIKKCCFIVLQLFFATQLSVSSESTIGKDSFYYKFNDLSLTDKYGKPFDIASLQGEVTLFNFIFTHCAWICPKQTGDLLRIYRTLPSEVLANVRFVSVSIDPERDTPQQLREFASRLGADYKRWHFVRGNPQPTRSFIQSLSLLQADDQGDSEQINHQTHLWLVSKAGRLMMRYDGLTVDHKRIASEIAELSKLSEL